MSSPFELSIAKAPLTKPTTSQSASCSSSLFENETFNLTVSKLSKELSGVQKDLAKVSAEKPNSKLVQEKRNIESLEESNKKLKTELKNSMRRTKYHEHQKSKIELNAVEMGQQSSSEISALKEKIQFLENKLKETEIKLKEIDLENDWLRSIVDDNKTVLTFDENKNACLPSMQKCVYNLLEHNVATGSVGPVIDACLKLADLSASRLQSRSTVANMNVQRLLLAQKQLSEEFVAKENVCLLSDETSKYGIRYQGYHARDMDGRYYVLGLREIATKSSEDALKGYKEILNDIDSCSENPSSDVSCRILVNTVSTMSDKAATEQKFHSLLETYRQQVLPDTMENYESLSEEEKTRVGRLYNFFCGLHSLVHLAEAAALSLCKVETGFFENPPIYDPTFLSKGESGTARLIRTASKAIGKGADEKNLDVTCLFSCIAKIFCKKMGLKVYP